MEYKAEVFMVRGNMGMGMYMWSRIIMIIMAFNYTINSEFWSCFVIFSIFRTTLRVMTKVVHDQHLDGQPKPHSTS